MTRDLGALRQRALRQGRIVDFTKYEALGNDYLVIDARRSPVDITPCAARALCDRHKGLGADGVIWGPFAYEGGPAMRVFNADGSECGKNSNALRIFAHYLRFVGYVTSDIFVIGTSCGPSCVKVVDPGIGLFEVALGRFDFDSSALPAMGPKRWIVDEGLDVGDEHLQISCGSIGTPHCVVFAGDVSAERLRRLAPRISRAPLFPQGINVALATIVDDHRIDAEIWERGAGHVAASGSAACAIACIARALGHVAAQISVHMPGGTIFVAIAPSGETFVRGTVRQVAQGRLASDFAASLTRRVDVARLTPDI